MKYIRTEDGIFEIINEEETFYKCKSGFFVSKDIFHHKNRVADTIEELCDEFDIIVKGKHHRYYNMEQVNWVIDQIKEERVYINGETIEKVDTIYGAIWTSKGLIYVAKMNDKGELRLL